MPNTKQKKQDLHQGATHNCKKGFTLAEVLITLGIIGIVAALTIPLLIQNTNSSKFASQYKKTLSTLNQAGLMAKAHFDSDYGTLTATGDCTASESLTNGEDTICGLFNATLKGATHVDSLSGLKANNKAYVLPDESPGTVIISKNTPWTPTSGRKGYTLADGSLVVFPKGLKGCTKATDQSIWSFIESNHECVGYIDVNGPTLPNKPVKCKDSDDNICVVPKDKEHMGDIFPIVFHDSVVEPASKAAKAATIGNGNGISTENASGKTTNSTNENSDNTGGGDDPPGDSDGGIES